MAQNLPSKIGKYEVIEVLGQGGMGTVYKAVDPVIGRLVAIKVIVAGYIDNPELLKRFYREAKAVGNLQHPNIVTVYDLGEENKNPYLVMQYLDGEPLNKIIAERREIPLIQKLGIVARVCDALAYAHQRDIVHRDVKPANVILLKDGQVKLLDFGIARLGNVGHGLTETQKGQVMGTMSYIAPEILNEEIADGRSDVYSAGVMLFELLTYRLPFESAELGSLIAKKMQGGPPPSLSKYLEDYPPELDEIVSRALAKDRDERYSTAQELVFDVERLIERLRRDMVSHYVDRARACISSAELGKAKDILAEVLKIDTQHTAAKQLLYEVQQSLQQQQRIEHIRQLRQRAEEAITLKQFDDASKFVEQAIKLDRTDNELLDLREHIQEVKQRGQQVKKLLHLAEVAQQTGELGVFQRALEDALELDPEDPQARVLQASLLRLQAEQAKEAEVRELLAAARREIAARKFEVALEYIHRAERLDDHRNDIPVLKQMVLAGQEQETRKHQLHQLCGAIQQELEANNLRIARDLADKALRAFPGEPALVRMKSAADSQLEADERRRFIEARIAAASKLLDAGEVNRALSLMQEASRQFPTDVRLRDFLQLVRQAALKNSVQREQAEMLVQARDAMGEKRFAEAVEILEGAQIKYPDLRDIGDLLALARKEHLLALAGKEHLLALAGKEQKLLAQKKVVADVSEEARALVAHQAFGDALILLEKTVLNNSDPSLQQFLQDVRAQAAEFDASLDALKKEAMALLKAGNAAEALAKLQSNAAQFGHSPRFREFLQRVEEQVAAEQESRQHVSRVLDEARLYLRRGALREAEAALAECRTKAPRDADVIALASHLQEAKAALQHEHDIEPLHALEVLPSPEPKTSTAASPTVKFSPAATVAALTPPAGTQVGSENAEADLSLAAASQVSASLRQANEAIGIGRYGDAIQLLETARLRFPDSAELDELLRFARDQQTKPQRQRYIDHATKDAQRLLAEKNFEEAVQVLEKAVARVPSEDLQILLRQARSQLEVFRRDLQAAIVKGKSLLAEGAPASATEFLRSRPASYQQSPEFRNLALQARDAALAPAEHDTADAAAAQTFTAAQGELDRPSPPAHEAEATKLFETARSEKAERAPRAVIEKQTAREEPATSLDAKPARPQKSWVLVGAIAFVVLLGAAILVWWMTRPTYLIVRAPQGTRVTIDGVVSATVESADGAAFKVSPGKHDVQVVGDGYEQWSLAVTLPRGERQMVTADLHHPPPPPPPPAPAATWPVVISSNIDAASAYVDGNFEESFEKAKKLTLHLTEGPHTISLRRQGYEDAAEQKVNVLANGKTKPLAFTLAKSSSTENATAPTDADLLIRARAGASIRVDGASKKVDPRGIASMKVKPGVHSVQVELPGYEPWSTTVTLQAGDSKTLTAEWTRELSPPPPAPSIPTPPTPAPAAKVLFFYASTDIVVADGEAKLTWATEHANGVSISGIGNVEAAGERKVHPTEKTTYTLTATGPGGNADPQSVTIAVKVEPPPPPKAEPAKETSSPPVAANSADFDAVRAVLEEYKAAYRDMTPDAFKAFWPNIPPKKLKVIRDEFNTDKALGVAEACQGEPAISGDTAQWTCVETKAYTVAGKREKRPPHTVLFQFKKVSGKWFMDGQTVQ